MGCADSMEPSTINEIGSVAKHGFEASDCPASPPSTKIMGICAPRNACAAVRMTTLRTAVAWGASSVMDVPYPESPRWGSQDR